MSSTTSCSTSHGMFLATAMAVSGTVILLAFGIQKSTRHHFLVNYLPQPLPRSCLSSDMKKDKKKKKVHFAEDVADPMGNSEEYRRKNRMINCNNNIQQHSSAIVDKESPTLSMKKGGGGRRQELLAGNKMALYNGILRDRVHHRVAYSY